MFTSPDPELHSFQSPIPRGLTRIPSRRVLKRLVLVTPGTLWDIRNAHRELARLWIAADWGSGRLNRA